MWPMTSGQGRSCCAASGDPTARIRGGFLTSASRKLERCSPLPFSNPSADRRYLSCRIHKRQPVSLLNSTSNFPDAAAVSANLTPSSRSGGSGVIEVFPHSAVSVQTGNFSCGSLCLTHAKVKGRKKNCRFLQDSVLTQVLRFRFFIRENITFCGRAPQAGY